MRVTGLSAPVVLLALASAAVPAQPTAPAPERAPAPAAAPVVQPRPIVQRVREIIAQRYVLPEKRPALDAVLAQGLSSGRYDVTDPRVLAERINADLERVGQDRHLSFEYAPAWAGRITASQAADEAEAAKAEGKAGSVVDRNPEIRSARMDNHGITQLRLLPGNIRYMEYDGFQWVEPHSAAALDNAMRFLAEGDAIIIDLRGNGGGSAAAVDYLFSHFVPPNQHLYTFYEGSKAKRADSLANLPAGRVIGKPLYVLVSGATNSAAEAFTGMAAGHKVGEIVGQNTSGGGYMNDLEAIDGGFVLSVSIARVVLASTGRDWERVGIAPTISAEVPAALEVAQAHALRRLAAAAPAEERPELEARAEWLSARSQPRTPAQPLTAYAGTYGERKAWVEGGKLHYQFGDRPPRQLVPLGGNLFTFDEDPVTRIQFLAANNRVTAVEIARAGRAPQGRYERTQ